MKHLQKFNGVKSAKILYNTRKVYLAMSYCNNLILGFIQLFNFKKNCEILKYLLFYRF